MVVRSFGKRERESMSIMSMHENAWMVVGKPRNVHSARVIF